MSCNCQNGQTYVNTCIPVPGATATSASYVLDLIHYLCGNKNICVSSSYQPTASLSYNVLSVESVGNSSYNCNIQVTGTITYMPYKGNNCSCNCPKTDNIFATLSVPVTASTTPTITAGGTVQCSPANTVDCCSVCNAVSVVCSFNVAQS